MLLAAALLFLPAPITFESLVAESSDLSRLYRRLDYKAAQASSYDRASTVASDAKSWFANGDAGKFLRTETVNGRSEFVMADLKGPGAVTRIWSANPSARIRFYFDGETLPTISEKLIDLLGGKSAPFGFPWAYESARGWNLYAPIPYAKSLKITVDDTDNGEAKFLYYHVGYRTYPNGTVVQSYAAQQGVAATQALKLSGERQTNPERFTTGQTVNQTFRLGPRESREFANLNGEIVISELRLQLLERNGELYGERNLEDEALNAAQSAVRNLVLTAEFDGVTTVSVPLADFFLIAGGLNEFNTMPISADEAGMLTSRFPMPFRKNAKITLTNYGDSTFTLNSFLKIRPLEKGAVPYLFHAQWKAERGNTRPMRDLECLRTTGEGNLVGTSMHVANPTPAWWGEGDEKIFIDGSAFPDFFGTGTEDFYGYAWCDPTPFHRPFNAQPRADGPGNKGHTQVARWFIADPIPYQKSLQFDIEMWHWEVVEADFDRTVIWYAKPSQSVPLVAPSALALQFYERPKPIKGATEGETLTVIEHKGGTIEPQGGFPGLSRGRQLWWKNGAEGSVLRLEVPVPADGEYEVIANVCTAQDYGKHRLTFAGNDLGEIDFYSKDLKWVAKPLGKFKLKAGTVELRVDCLGKRPEAVSGNMFGLDYLILKPVP